VYETLLVPLRCLFALETILVVLMYLFKPGTMLVLLKCLKKPGKRGVSGRVVKVVDFKPFAPHCFGLNPNEILSCEEHY
jgi:hypothetical protein